MRYIIFLLLIIGATSCSTYSHVRKFYSVGTEHTVRGQYLAGVAQGDGKYEIVIGTRDGLLLAWVERDGKCAQVDTESLKACRSPYWPLPLPRATRRGTPKELGLYDDKGDPTGHCWLLTVPPRHRIVTWYHAASGKYGKQNVNVCVSTNNWHGIARYWLEFKADDGHVYRHPCLETYRYHFSKKQHNPRNGEWQVKWRGNLEEYDRMMAGSKSEAASKCPCKNTHQNINEKSDKKQSGGQ